MIFVIGIFCVQVTELLVKHGATVNVSDLWKFTPLHEAAAKAGGHTSLYNLFSVADPRCLFWIPDPHQIS